eukprot:TRINITY_DN101114_c0_g1_i1.p1 TRINITY_DN101114_c0_g1~~TRINITY_DN101114_c0_g1_i1.p1  ORF type:complete len:414 (-),score=100.78 TRINITY_DN101114_c0_g1_i1:40-1281(-)
MGVCIGKGAAVKKEAIPEKAGAPQEPEKPRAQELSADNAQNGAAANVAAQPLAAAVNGGNKAKPANNAAGGAPAEAAPPAAPENSSAKPVAEGVVLLSFPNAKEKASVVGTTSDVTQKAFEDKKQEQCLGEKMKVFKVGAACKKGLKPESPNQDDYCVFRADGLGIYGVFDGHGPYGHDVANFVQEALPRCFVRNVTFENDPEMAMSSAFLESHRLCTESQGDGRFDCRLSGTTATLAMHREGNLYVAHVGDSRAVLAKTTTDAASLKSEDITTDHKPTCEPERKRIQESGGQVRRLEGDLPHRVFVSGKLYPGLSMTRSIGDTVGSTAGVTCTPEVKCLTIEKDWKFMLICTDGIWEFVSSQEAVDIVNKYGPAEVQAACEALASEAWNRWIKEEGNIVDDITVVCCYFNED